MGGTTTHYALRSIAYHRLTLWCTIVGEGEAV